MDVSTSPPYAALPSWKRDIDLFWTYFRIASLVVGGGYAILAAARRADDWEEWAAERRKEREAWEAEKRDLLRK